MHNGCFEKKPKPQMWILRSASLFSPCIAHKYFKYIQTGHAKAEAIMSGRVCREGIVIKGLRKSPQDQGESRGGDGDRVDGLHNGR